MAIVFWERDPAAQIPHKAQRQGNGHATIVCVFHVELGEVPHLPLGRKLRHPLTRKVDEIVVDVP